MTRRSPIGRTTPRGGNSPGAGGGGPAAGTDESSLASLRRRQPVAFWMAVIGALAMILTTFGSLLSAFL